MSIKIPSTNWFDLDAVDDEPVAVSPREVEVTEPVRPIIKEIRLPVNQTAEQEPEDGEGRSKTRSRWRRVVSIVVFLTVVAGWFMFLRPTSLGGPASILVVRGVSMQPTMNYGDVVIAHRHSAYEVGDIIAFRVPEGEIGAGTVVIHRIIGGDASSGFETQGDGNNEPDVWRPVPTDILGAARWRIPLVGRLFSVLRSTTGIAILAGFVAALLVVMGIEEPERRRGRHVPDPKPDAPLPPTMGADHDDRPDELITTQVLLALLEAADADPLDDIITPEIPLAPPPVANADPLDDIITPDVPLAPLESAQPDPLDDIISLQIASDDDDAVGEYWGDDIRHLSEVLRNRKRQGTLFDDDLEEVARRTPPR